MIRKRRGTAIIILMILIIAIPSSCGGIRSGEYIFNYEIKEFKTDIDQTPFEAQILLSLALGSGEEELAYNPNWKSSLGDTPIYPYSFCVNPEGLIIIDDLYNERLVIYGSNGDYMNAISYTDIGNMGINPFRILASSEAIYCIYYNTKVVSLDYSGKVLGDWNFVEQPEGWEGSEWFGGSVPYIGPDGVLLMIGRKSTESGEAHTTITKWDERGNPIASFSFDISDSGGDLIAVDGDGNFYRNKFKNDKGNSINIYNSVGKFIRSISIEDSDGPVRIMGGIDIEGSLYLIEYTGKDHITYKYDRTGKAVSSHRFSKDTDYNYFYYDRPIVIVQGYLYQINSPSTVNIEKEKVEIYRAKL